MVPYSSCAHIHRERRLKIQLFHKLFLYICLVSLCFFFRWKTENEKTKRWNDTWLHGSNLESIASAIIFRFMPRFFFCMQLPSALSQYRNIERTTTTTTHSFLILLPCVTFSSSRFRCRLALFNAACVDLLHISILSIKPWRHLFLSSVPLHCDSIESIDLRGQTNVEQLIHIAMTMQWIKTIWRCDQKAYSLMWWRIYPCTVNRQCSVSTYFTDAYRKQQHRRISFFCMVFIIVF